MPTFDTNHPIFLVLRRRVVESRVIRKVKRDLYVDALGETEMELTPTPGQVVRVRWVDDEILWEQPGQVRDVLDPIPLIVISLLEKPVSVEQRGARRVKVGVPLEYRMLRSDADSFVTTTIDLSATGLRFLCQIPTWIGLELRLSLTVEQKVLNLIGRIIRVTPGKDIRGKQGWEVGAQFIRITVLDRRVIDEFVGRMLNRQ